MRRSIWFSLVVALQIGFLLAMIAMKWSTLAYGDKVLLKTAPVDPWDLFRGDYVILNYEISSLDLALLSGDKEFKRNDTVYVTLEKEGKYWVPRAVSHSRPGDGSLAIRGKVQYYDEYGKILNISYGIDSYYVPQHQGREIENQRVHLDAEVSIDNRGNSALSRLFLKDKEITFE